jgi:hypothetical protein
MKINIKLVIVSLIIVVLLYLLFFDTINENYSNYMPIEDYTLLNTNMIESNSNLNECKNLCDQDPNCTAYMVNNNTCYHTTTVINKNNLEYKKDNKIFVSICDPKTSMYLKMDEDIESTQTPYKPPFVMPNTFCNNNNYDLESCENLSRLCKQ